MNVAAHAPQASERREPPTVVPEATDDARRLAAVEAGIDEVRARCKELTGLFRTDHEERLRTKDEVSAAQLDELRADIADLRAESTASSDANAARLVAQEERVRQSITGIAELHNAQQRELKALGGALAEAVSEIRRLAESNAELRRVQMEADRRLVEKDAEIAERPPRGEVTDAVRSGLEEIRAHLDRMLEAQRGELLAQFGEGLSSAQVAIASLEQRLQEKLVALAQLIDGERRDAAASLDEGVRDELTAVVDAVQELTRFRARIEETLEGLARRALEDDVRLGALSSSADASAKRLHELERKLEESVDRFTALIETQWAAPESTESNGAVDLLADLERQLRAAETRLTGLTADTSER